MVNSSGSFPAFRRPLVETVRWLLVGWFVVASALAASAEMPGYLKTALDRIYERMKTIHFDDMQYRRDIGWRALVT